jgi:phage-related protein
MIKLFSALPDPVQDVLLVLAGIVAIGGPLLTFLASAKSAMATLGIISSTSAGGIGAAGVATNLLSGAMRALPILAIIGLIVLLVQNWDKVTAVVDKAWEAIKNFGEYAWDAIKGFGSQIAGWVSGIVNQIGQIPGKMLSVGKNIVRGLWDGITSMLDWFENRLANSFVGKTVSKVMNLFGVKSPSTVFAEIGENLVKGLSQGIDQAQKLANVSMTGLANATMAGFQPQLAGYGTAQAAPIQITINAGLGTDPYALGREVNNALTKYGKVSSRVVRG